MIINQTRRTLDEIIRFTTSIGETTVFEGKFTTSDNIVLRGTIISDSNMDGAVIIERSARWLGNISANTVIVLGAVTGNIVALNKIELLKDSVTIGDLNCPQIAIELGAIHNGIIHMKNKTHVTSFNEKRTNNNSSKT